MSTITFSDLREPVLSDEQRRLVEEAERHPVELRVEAVVAAASAATGLDDFGPPDFRERLHVLLDEVDQDANVTALVRRTHYDRCVQCASNRLLTFDLLRRHPEIHEIEIERPIVIAGLPRSGTTHLLNLVSIDPRVRSLPYWEVLCPVPVREEDPELGGVDRRLERAEELWQRDLKLNPNARAYHAKDPHHISEDGELQLQDFASYVWEWQHRAPKWRDYYYAHDQTPHYEYEKTMLKVLEWRSGVKKRWVVKSPQHFEQLRPIMNVFPDALVVFTHRDPIASLQSIATMKTYQARTRDKVVDADWLLEYWTDRVQHLLEAYVRDVELVPEQQRFDVPFEEFMQDDVAMVARIYEAAGLPVTAETRATLRGYMADHQRGKHGVIANDLRLNFGVDPDEIRKRFAFYAACMPAGAA
jgi:hypothetical protein